MHIVVIPGTNRIGSLSAKLAALVIADYRALSCDVDLLDVALEPDFLAPTAYKQPAAAITARVARFLRADGVVFIVPEYNGSYPGVLKLFIDMLPEREGFTHRPCAFIGHAAGRFHGLRAVEHLQAVAAYRNAHCFPNRVFIGDSFKQYAADGTLVDAELAKRLAQQASGFVNFIGTLKK